MGNLTELAIEVQTSLLGRLNQQESPATRSLECGYKGAWDILATPGNNEECKAYRKGAILRNQAAARKVRSDR
jgi:hypothetical protein